MQPFLDRNLYPKNALEILRKGNWKLSVFKFASVLFSDYKITVVFKMAGLIT